ncbi:Hsp20/alpha crystallin family protein [Rhodoferax sp.]|uniref:Hsp20/alpha crystallin family protein n=1 Tax=Rhodoferax sp. TaxID=50421 RepID=UPI002718A0A7|nr:Hsp20/alpha crystallin family protein [Rhodoferax sp.]MDO9145986.1 Hsp20/alpha crystallin family protein [Rhodoferax sp.]MDP1527997.1 Hsp20/alpha crystallin family protein [Rhodoferax sp.]MDP1942648.1 Hsp20/alpha crystallin family protein [Rhodoferax sp.]MDP2439947.1 Hsp20/alpha crystallin family protein [Rhodoferax sp.]MDP3191898.1 Hsp20/alpha crystallin family protein [Rhodoferax sp.]
MNMLDSLKQTGQTLGREITRAWESLSEGWHELLSRSSNALTHFKRNKTGTAESGGALAAFPSWSLLAGELEETAKDMVVRVELPGLDKDDCQIRIEGNVLYLSGEKRFERDTDDSTYHVMERAYGAFQRAIPLPRNVAIDQAEATFKNGVLTVRLPKEGGDKGKSIAVS